jgi:Tfp pilus assembly protein PilO
MGKLSNKETILILVVINILLYYLLYVVAVGPLKNNIVENNEEIATLQAEYDEDYAIVSKKGEYEQQKADLTEAKKTLFAQGFPNTDAEKLHAFINKVATENNIIIENITIDQQPRIAATDTTQKETDVYDNTITVQAVATYADATKLIKAIEDEQKTSLLTTLNLSGQSGEMTIGLGYDFLSADKTEIGDPIFDHDFNPAKGDTALFR